MKRAGIWQDELQTGRYKPASKVTWTEFRQRYEDEVLASLAPATEAKNSDVLNSVEEVLSPARPADLMTARISHYQKVLRDRGLAEFTIRGHLSVIRSVRRWAADMEFVPEPPKIKMPDRAKGSSVAKGRAVTGEEFDRMIKAVREIVGMEAESAWKFLLRGLWWSGLRLGEALNLSWDGDDGPTVHVDEDDVMLRIPGDSQKSGKDQLLPIALEFAEFLLAVPRLDRTGPVFGLPGRPKQDAVSEAIAAIGAKAVVKVKVNAVATTGTEGKKRKVRGKSRSPVKYASAHDLRRSFCDRWAQRVMPQILMELARHESIETTMKFYVGRNAKATAKLLREALAGKPAGNTSGNFRDSENPTNAATR